MRKQGRIVTIYQYPKICREPLGEAKLIKYVRTTDDGLQAWEVRFKGDEEIVVRLVNFGREDKP